MSLSHLIKSVLDTQAVSYTTIDLVQSVQDEAQSPISEVPLENIVKHCLFERVNDLFLVIYPANRALVLDKLMKTLGGGIKAVAETEAEVIKEQAKYLSNLNSPSGLQIIVDEHLGNNDYLFYRATDLGKGFRVEMDDFQRVVSDEFIGISFTIAEKNVPLPEDESPNLKLRERLKRLLELPPMSDTTNQLLSLRSEYEVSTDRLIKIVERDPILAAQVISYANSALFGHAGKIKTLKDAIYRVLGVNAVMDFALGLSIGKNFSIPENGPLGATRLWRHATYSAALMQKLATLVPWGERPEIGTAYLAGLLHDIGFFILGYLFKKEFNSLNKLIAAHPDVPITQIEKNLMGITHCDLAHFAMRQWGMPEEISVVARQHHNGNYQGEHAVYINLLRLVETLLAPQGLSSTCAYELDESLLEKTGLTEEQIILAADEVIQESAALEQLVSQLCV